MIPAADFPQLCELFFAKRLVAQLKASQHTISSYAYTFRLLVKFAHKRLGRPPSKLTLAELDAPFLAEFLNELETTRHNDARSRNARLAAIRSFYQYAALEVPQHAELIQRVLAIPYKRLSRRPVDYLLQSEVEALLCVVEKDTWLGRRTTRSCLPPFKQVFGSQRLLACDSAMYRWERELMFAAKERDARSVALL